MSDTLLTPARWREERERGSREGGERGSPRCAVPKTKIVYCGSCCGALKANLKAVMISPEWLVFRTDQASLFALGGASRGLFPGNRSRKCHVCSRGGVSYQSVPHRGTRGRPAKRPRRVNKAVWRKEDERSFPKQTKCSLSADRSRVG